MATSDDMPSETSPLLSPDGDDATPKALNGNIVNGTIPDGAPQDGAYLERHDSIDERRAAQFEGRPDIRKQLKYILPAISIGVLEALICLVVAPADRKRRFSCLQRIKQSLFPSMAELGANSVHSTSLAGLQRPIS
jgi:hypothetical protein